MTSEANRQQEFSDGRNRRDLAERYVLEDPTLDRHEFEKLMEEDLQLALAVADCVSELQQVQNAIGQLNDFAPASRGTLSDVYSETESVGTRRSPLIVFAIVAILLLATLPVIGRLFDQDSAEVSTSVAADLEQLPSAVIAAGWLAMGPAESEVAFERLDVLAVEQEDESVEMRQDIDWMLSVSEEFFSESES